MGLPFDAADFRDGPEFTPQQYRMLVTQVYQEKNPSMMGELDFIFSRYEGREEELFSQVCLKYGADRVALTNDVPPRTQLEEGELVEAIVRLEEEHGRRMRLLRRKRDEVKELTLLIRLGSERRRCHACDLGICRAQRLTRYAGEVCWLVAEESRCAEEEAGPAVAAGVGQEAQNPETEEDLWRGMQWVIKELRAILPHVAQEDPQLAELAQHLSTTKFQKPQATQFRKEISDSVPELDVNSSQKGFDVLDDLGESEGCEDSELISPMLNESNQDEQRENETNETNETTKSETSEPRRSMASKTSKESIQMDQPEPSKDPSQDPSEDLNLSKELSAGVSVQSDSRTPEKPDELDPDAFEQLAPTS